MVGGEWSGYTGDAAGCSERNADMRVLEGSWAHSQVRNRGTLDGGAVSEA